VYSCKLEGIVRKLVHIVCLVELFVINIRELYIAQVRGQLV